ncbi:MAG: hypothetical protein ABIK07_22185 [Planctomycetota bacterium]
MLEMDSYKIYREFGVAALFIAMYITTVWFLIKKLMQDRIQEVKRTKEIVEVVMTSNMVLSKNTEILEKLKSAIESEEKKSSELLMYLRTKDELAKERRD